ncbi:MAG: sulfatase-like hydrolase/transferase, partial [Planctomycetota bacterium]
MTDQPPPPPPPHRRGSLLPLLALPAAFFCGFSCSGEESGFFFEGPPPNIVLFLADDLGWSDLGYKGGEMKTPRIDGLAKKGVVLDRFYVFPSCSPTRAA